MHLRCLIVIGLIVQLFAAQAIALGKACDGSHADALPEACCASTCCEDIGATPGGGEPFCPCSLCPDCTVNGVLPAQRLDERGKHAVPSFPSQTVADTASAPALASERDLSMRGVVVEPPPRQARPDLHALLGRWLH